MGDFLTDNFIRDININVIARVFPKLNRTHSDMLSKYLQKLINIIAHEFFFDNSNKYIYEQQFRQNSYRDLVALLLLLIPFIHGNTQEIKSLNDIWLDTTSTVKPDANISSPFYKFSNTQYSRCIRNPENIQERKFDEQYLAHNYYFLVDTISRCSNKLYVNWVDILPYTLDTIEQTKLYTNTDDLIKSGNLTDWVPTEEYKFTPKGLNIHDIYDTLANEFYFNIEKIKWTIYDVRLKTGTETRLVPILLCLQYLFDYRSCIQNIGYTSLDDVSRERFSTQWASFLNLLESSGNVQIGDLIIETKGLNKIAMGIIYSFDNLYGKSDRIEGYIPLDAEDGDDGEDGADESQPFVLTALTSLRSIGSENIYEFFLDTIQKFKQTIFSRYIFTQDPDGTTRPTTISEFSPLAGLTNAPSNVSHVKLTLKNLYNYAKSLVHYTSSSISYRQSVYPKYFRSCSKEIRQIILNRLNNKDPSLWFNIPNNIANTYDIDDPRTIRSYNRIIHQIIQENLAKFIISSMGFRGVLSYFRPYSKITDESVLVENRRKQIFAELGKTNLSEKSPVLTNSYYYLTGTTYNQVKSKSTDFFSMCRQDDWYMAYAMNWISQISFFQKYLNNRVIFVTGSTGVGKSTQVPKLLLYGLKALDYRNAGSVVCTQPRRAPTEMNSITISSQLGIPVNEKDYYVQYKHKQANWVKNVHHQKLKLVTDGSLISEITNPLLIDKSDNLYDIVIVDEAHEHNKNMDIILTMMKQACYYNNSLKLVIISATMDSDEPVYRRFYRDINDNRAYPLDMGIADNSLDRINIDRRFHISPPGQTTKYKIVENWVPNTDPLELINQIIKNTPSGYIAYFQPGLAEISAEIEKLHKILPPNVIALPFHSKLTKYQRDLIERIDKSLGKIKFDRLIPFSEVTEEVNESGTNKYSRVVLVCTNIFEASLTVNNLIAVVDTGTEKTAIYNYKYNGTSIAQNYISDASRLQRKGRVGRVASGTVYYLYPEGTTTYNKKQFDISISNIYLELYDRLISSNTGTKLFEESSDPNFIKDMEIDNLREIYKELSNFISTHYFATRKFYSYQGLDSHYDYINRARPVNIYTDGYDYQTLNDSTGKFYIVHPEELYLTRNIIGEITGLSPNANLDDIEYNQTSKSIKSKKMESFWNALVSNLFLVLYPSASTTVFSKTDYGLTVKLINQELSAISVEDFDIRFVHALLYSMALDISDSIGKLICAYSVVSNDFLKTAPTGQLVNGKYRSNITELKSLLGPHTSDSDAILSLLGDLDKYFANNKINLDNGSSNDKLHKYLINAKREIFSGLPIKESIAKLLKEQINQGKISNSPILSDRDFNELRKLNLTSRVISDGINPDSIAQWANSRYIKPSVIRDYISKYLYFTNIMFNISINPRIGNGLSRAIEELRGLVPKYIAPSDKTTLALLYGFKTTIGKNIKSNYYLSLKEPEITNIYTYKTIGNFIKSTMVEPKYLTDYILYLTEDIESNTIGSLHWVKPELIKEIGWVYSWDVLYPKCMGNLAKELTIEPNIDKLITQKLSTVIGLYKQTLRNILGDLDQIHDPAIFDKLIGILHDSEYIKYRKNLDKKLIQ